VQSNWGITKCFHLFANQIYQQKEESMFKEKRVLALVLIFVGLFVINGWGGEAQAQTKYPDKPIDIIVPLSAGGACDITSRIAAVYLSKKWRVPVNVINKPGGNTIPACLEVYQANLNGYTMLGDGTSSSYLLVVAIKNLPIKIMDRTFIAGLSSVPMMIIVPANSPFKSLKDLEAEAKRDPEAFTWSSMGGTGGPDIIVRQFLQSFGVDVRRTKPVIGKGGSDTAIFTAGGHVKMGVATPVSASALLKGGLVKPLAIADVKRHPDYPDVPTAAEEGFPDVDYVPWFGVSGPPNMPSNIVNIWNSALEEMSKDPESISKMKNAGMVPLYRNSQMIKDHVIRRMGQVEKLWGLK
jgi:tripartite-type tricarboxylate transporter receptor subunit TctC